MADEMLVEDVATLHGRVYMYLHPNRQWPYRCTEIHGTRAGPPTEDDMWVFVHVIGGGALYQRPGEYRSLQIARDTEPMVSYMFINYEIARDHIERVLGYNKGWKVKGARKSSYKPDPCPAKTS